MPVHDGHHVQEAVSHRDVGQVRAPRLIHASDPDVAEQVRVHDVSGGAPGRERPWSDRSQAHEPHQATDALPAHTMSSAAQLARHLTPPREYYSRNSKA